LSCVQTPLPRLTSSTPLTCRARRATWGAIRRARWSAGHRADSTARPRHSKRGARDHREAVGVSPIEHIEHLEYLEKRWIDLARVSSPRARTLRVRGRAARVCLEEETAAHARQAKDEQGRAWQGKRATSPSLCSYTRQPRIGQVSAWGDDPRDCERSCVWAQRLASASLSAHRGPPM
ncbi:hypothetical protein T492DRAFT_1016395, partial [Pavlovales sp. CCMP2436]